MGSGVEDGVIGVDGRSDDDRGGVVRACAAEGDECVLPSTGDFALDREKNRFIDDE